MLNMKRIIFAGSALAFAASLGACTLSSTEALGVATICGISSDLGASTFKMTSAQSSALAVVQTFCANPPTTAAAISSDVVASAILLQPLVVSLLTSAKTPSATASKLSALITDWPEAPADMRATAVQYEHTHR